MVAEGVETAAQLACLQQLNCDSYQGYLYSKPLPAARFVALLSAGDTLQPVPAHSALTSVL